MDRGNLVKWLFLGLAVFLFLQFGLPKIMGKHEPGQDRQPFARRDDVAQPAARRAPEQTGTSKGPRVEAVLSTKGGSLLHLHLLDKKYVQYRDTGGGSFLGSLF